MLSKEEFKGLLHAIVEQNQKTVRIIRSPGEVDSLNIDKVAEGFRTFPNYDESMLKYILKSISEGKEVAIQAVGSQNIMVTAAYGLFRKHY